MTDTQTSQKQAIDALVQYVNRRLKAGELADAVRADLITQGLDSRLADRLLAALDPPPDKWERGMLGWSLFISGIVVMPAGGVLWLGNQLGFFPTFPFAGTLAVFAGAALFVIGGGKQWRRTSRTT
jgi:hypothetical protein